jgi:hypothetical protein
MLVKRLLNSIVMMLLTDLHASTETKDQVKGGLFLNIVIRQSPTVLKLLAGEDKTLLIWRNAFLILNLRLDVIDGVARFDLKGDGLSGHYM